ncbi:MAG: decaprenylphospho-beta-D-erythro-pentofuranosid-2-ulose 2-reductase [Halieaceae bacterium]|jgi:decaprenylphospho-beta-D-erythro-pentofuranosid-2-ulose 2-reductase
MNKLLIIGACSAIATATARRYAERGCAIHLVARDQQHLALIAKDLEIRGASAVTMDSFLAADYASHAGLLERASEALGGLEMVLIAHGSLGDQGSSAASFAVTLAEFETNTLSVISLLTLLAPRLEKQAYGTIAVISSVAGDRGRQSNYVYGAAKGAVSVFTQGLRNRLAASGVHVVTIKPGFVDTPMTAGLPKGGPLWATPEQIAMGIERAIDRKQNVAYLPWFWRYVMLIIRCIPEAIFKRLSL